MNWALTDLKASDGIRWAAGEANGRRSSTWRFWGNKKGDFYLSARTLGASLKASLHRDGRCHIGLTSDYAAREQVASRHMDRWTVRIDQFVKAIQVIMPHDDLSAYATDDKEPMRWLRPPQPGCMAIAGIVVLPTDQIQALGGRWPGAGQGVDPVGVIASESGTAFVVHWENPITTEQQATLRQLRSRMEETALAKGIERAPGRRAILVGQIGDGEAITRTLFDISYQAA
jgi:hypothetical protein